MAKAGDLVSVVIPSYNHARFLGEAIESVLGQSYPNFELTVVDDGSTDKSSEIVKRYRSVQYVYQQNAGPSVARNTGLSRSSGKHIVFLDADDRLLPDALKTGVRRISENANYAFVAGHCRVIDSNGSILDSPRQYHVDRDHYLELLRGGNFIWCPATVLYRRATLAAEGGFDPKQRVEDYELYLRITRKYPVLCHDEVVAEYRQHRATRSREVLDVQRAALATHASQWNFIKADKRLSEAYIAGRHFWEHDFPLQQLVTRIREVVREKLPHDAIIAIASGGNDQLLQLDGRQAWHFPEAEDLGSLFAEGPEGSVAAEDWIKSGTTYKFTLCDTQEASKPLADLFVRGISVLKARHDEESTIPGTTEKKGASLRAMPNPVFVGEKPGTTTISWSTGNGAAGRVFVSRVGAYSGRDPLNSDEAARLVQATRRHGAQYLLLPDKSFYWQDRYRDFRERMEMRYPAVAREDETCLILDLR